MKANGSKSIHVTFITRREVCPPVHINNVQLPQEEDIKYLGLYLDGSLTWHKHIFAKRRQLGITLIKMCWLLWHKSKLSTVNKVLIYITVFKPIWTYGIQIWGTATASNIDIVQRFQSKALHMILDSPTVKEAIRIPKWPHSEPHGDSKHLAINTTPAKWSAWQIPSVIVVFLIL
jgi:hypothetical protein